MGNSLNVVLMAGYLNVRMAGSASDRHCLKVRLTNGLTYLLTYLYKKVSQNVFVISSRKFSQF